MDFLAKLREALGLDKEASEDQVLDAIKGASLDVVREALGLEADADTKAIAAKVTELKDADEPASLEDRAKAEGKVVVSADEITQLRSDAKSGADAAKELRQSKFDAAFAKALDEARIDAKDETKARMQKLYELAPEETLEDLANRPKLVSTEPRGSSAGPIGDGEAPAGLDPEHYELHQRVLAYQRDHTDVDYVTALDRVQAEGAAV